MLHDRQLVVDLIELTLNHGMFTVRAASSLEDAEGILQGWQPHMAVIDMDHDDSGGLLKLLGASRTLTRTTTPALGLTRRGDLRTKLRAFGLGVDDILTMPFSPEELLARSIVITRRSLSPNHPIVPTIRLGDIEIDIVNRQVRAGDSVVVLSGIEQSLLYLLASRGGLAVSRDEILDAIWGADFVAESNVVDRHVRSLRVKLHDDYRNPPLHRHRARSWLSVRPHVLEPGLGGYRRFGAPQLRAERYGPCPFEMTARNDTPTGRRHRAVRSACRLYTRRPVAGAGPFWGWARPLTLQRTRAWQVVDLGSARRKRRSSALWQGRGAVAGPEALIQQTPDAEVPGAVGWGVLGLVQRWPNDGAATDESDVWPDQSPAERHELPLLTLLPPLGAAFDRGAAAVALRQVLAEWRIGARDLDRYAEGSLEWSGMRAQVAALRDAYHRLFREIRGSAAP